MPKKSEYSQDYAQKPQQNSSFMNLASEYPGGNLKVYFSYITFVSSLGRYVFGSEISYNKAPPRLPGLGC